MKLKSQFVGLLLLLLPVLVFSQRIDKLGKYAYVSDSFTRAEDETPYDIGDLLSCETPRFLKFANVVKTKGTSGDIIGAEVSIDSMAGLSALSLLVFDDTTDVTLPADNEPIKFTYANYAHLVARVEGLILAQVDSSDLAYTAYFYFPIAPFVCSSSSRNLYGVLTLGAAYTPKALGLVRVGLWIRRN